VTISAPELAMIPVYSNRLTIQQSRLNLLVIVRTTLATATFAVLVFHGFTHHIPIDILVPPLLALCGIVLPLRPPILLNTKPTNDKRHCNLAEFSCVFPHGANPAISKNLIRYGMYPSIPTFLRPRPVQPPGRPHINPSRTG